MKELATPVRVDIYFTHQCNLSCPFCYYRSFQKAGRRDLPFREWELFLDELGRLGVLHVGIYGGEPLIRPDFTDFVRCIVRNRMRFNLISNGTLLTGKLAGVIAESGRCDSVQISVDGTEEDHDRVRGKGNWRKAVDALLLLNRHGVRTHVNMVIGRHNVNTALDTVPFLADEIKVKQIRVNVISSRDDIFLPKENGRLSNEEFAALTKNILPLAENYPQIHRDSAPLALYREIVEPFKPEAARPFRICSGIWNALAVRADGAVLPCSPTEYHVLGRINRDSLEDIWRNHQKLQGFRREILQGRQLTDPECENCPYTWYCRQVCPVDRTASRYCRKELAGLIQ